MIFTSFFKALGQLGDPKFLKVFFLGITLSVISLVMVYILFLAAIGYFVPESVTLPLIGEVAGLQTVLSWGVFFLVIVFSVFLMVPVASLFTGLFLDSVAAAVEARHYPELPLARQTSLNDTLKDTMIFLGVLIAVNAFAFGFYVFSGPLAPLVFWAYFVEELFLDRCVSC